MKIIVKLKDQLNAFIGALLQDTEIENQRLICQQNYEIGFFASRG